MILNYLSILFLAYICIGIAVCGSAIFIRNTPEIVKIYGNIRLEEFLVVVAICIFLWPVLIAFTLEKKT